GGRFRPAGAVRRGLRSISTVGARVCVSPESAADRPRTRARRGSFEGAEKCLARRETAGQRRRRDARTHDALPQRPELGSFRVYRLGSEMRTDLLYRGSTSQRLSRRDFLSTTADGVYAAALAVLLGRDGLAQASESPHHDLNPRLPHFRARAKAV